ncbi:DNA-processing protein DprA [Companilactobacillus kimchiensis]|uniref:DNA-processing protein DprA n=1 Tax=Companilactobacillus kimchiensis TaxID=993692 RepID=UPI00070F982A|nr:DNA-processing protein DprA [Companilactobacillus kimchiensis]
MNLLTQLIIACLKIHHVGPISVRNFLKENLNFESVLNDFDMLQRKSKGAIQRAIKQGDLDVSIWKSYVQGAQEEIILAKIEGIQLVNYQELSYPQRLLTLHNFPVIIYAKGNLKLLNAKRSVAIIGTREPSKFSLERSQLIIQYFVSKGYVIISGLAQGCDTYAHQVTLANKWKNDGCVGCRIRSADLSTR